MPVGFLGKAPVGMRAPTPRLAPVLTNVAHAAALDGGGVTQFNFRLSQADTPKHQRKTRGI